MALRYQIVHLPINKMANIYIFNSPQTTVNSYSTYEIIFIATNLDNGDLLSVINGNLEDFKKDNPDFLEYYDGNWFQNYYPDSPGNNPLEKYLNAMENINPEIPKWTQILPAIANSSLYLKLMDTKESNAFSALLTVINYRNMEMFKSLTKKVLEGIPGGMLESDRVQLDTILSECNFPSVDEILG